MYRIIPSLATVLILSFTPLAAVKAFDLIPISTYETGIFDESAAEISAYDPVSKLLFVTNAFTGEVEIIDIKNPTQPNKINSLTVGGVNSIAFKNNILAVAIEADIKQDPGQVKLFDINGNLLNSIQVGALPDMLTFSPDGQIIVVANEGEPNDNYTVDPVGSISIINLTNGVNNPIVITADFSQFNLSNIDPNIRIFGPNATVAQDLEPEYITVNNNSTKAWVSLQENNALAIVNLETGVVENLVSLGFKDHSLPANSLDVSDKDGAINLTTYPNLVGMYQPDAIAAYEVNGKTYIVTANEGDSRDYEGFSEETRVKNLDLDPIIFPNASQLQAEQVLGRLKTTNTLGDLDNDGDVDRIYAFGGRSFSILDEDGKIVFDSGDEFAKIIAQQLPNDFNSDNDENNSFDQRSDDKGAEPEGVTIGEIDGRIYAFIGLERIGGIMVYDVTNPLNPTFVIYVNNRDFTGEPELGTAGDLAPEGLLFISPTESPNHQPLLVVTNEVSGTTTLYSVGTTSQIESVPESTSLLSLLGLLAFLSRKKSS